MKTISKAWLIAIVLTVSLFGLAAAHDGHYDCERTDHEDGSWDLNCIPVSHVPTETPTPGPMATETPTVAPSATPLPTGTPTPAPTSTPVPTATMPPMDHSDALYWHAPGAHLVNGVQATAHEHGDAPPQWVLDYNRISGIGEAGTGRPAFEHVAGTPNENGHDGGLWWKHTAFKGWAGRFGTVDWYLIQHQDINPSGHPSRFHSYQIWLRDATGAVSHVSGWQDFGIDNNTAPQVVETCGQDSGIRPIMKVNAAGCPVNSITFENWYSQAGYGPIDFGLNVNPNYRAGGDPLNWTTWSAIGGVRNLTRRIEFAYYDSANSPYQGTYWSDQFGVPMSGAGDARCNTLITVGSRTYTRACIKQYIAPSLPAIVFPNNAIQRTFPGAGIVQLPN